MSFANHPVGISSHNGPIYTNAVLGFVNVTSLSAYNSSYKYAPYGASVQLNVVTEAITPYQTYYFWLQNIVDFLTNNDTFSIEDNI
ncbi:thermopsin family protease [Sulfolobus tengchongensis]|uniref:Thermopsin family protease n=1 Tax=Sulfolobus tengchongensis TaxID=207809 RepID=A0AAX4L1N5_9CREN